MGDRLAECEGIWRRRGHFFVNDLALALAALSLYVTDREQPCVFAVARWFQTR